MIRALGPAIILVTSGCLDFDKLRGSAGDGGVCRLPGGPTDCAGRGFLLCDGFETSSGTNFPSWTTTNVKTFNPDGPPISGTALRVVGAPSPVCQGGNAAQAVIVGGSQVANLEFDMASFPKKLYVRAFVDVPAGSAMTGIGLIALSSSNNILRLGFGPGLGDFVVDRTFSTNLGSAHAPTVASDRWFCVELGVVRDPTAGRVTVSVDSAVIADFNNVVTEPTGITFDTLRIGVTGSQAGHAGSSSLFLDEVVVSSTPIGCT